MSPNSAKLTEEEAFFYQLLETTKQAFANSSNEIWEKMYLQLQMRIAKGWKTTKTTSKQQLTTCKQHKYKRTKHCIYRAFQGLSDMGTSVKQHLSTIKQQ